MIANNLSTLEKTVNTETHPYMEGVSIDHIFDLLSSTISDKARLNNKNIHFELIAWEPICAAADRRLLLRTIQEILEYAISHSKSDKIFFKAYPSNDGVFVTLSCHFEKSNDSHNVMDRHNISIPSYWRSAIEKMSGSLQLHNSPNGEESIHIQLVQWLPDEEPLSAKLFAA
jgi:hypothetical protein